MSLFEYYVALRGDILGIVTGVENSAYNLLWDNTTPNSVTKTRLEKLYDKYIAAAKEFGLLVVTRHCDCPNPNHSSYATSNRYGLDISYRGSGYVWGGGQFYQGVRRSICPCSNENRMTEHNVIDDIIYDENADADVCKRLEIILGDIFDSIVCAGDKRPRSAIREYLLRAVLRINDELLPEPMNAYIQNHCAPDSGQPLRINGLRAIN
ncbi:hypothetical protein SAMN04515620_11377 [Collimonas sp. OK607]|uniref:hypothetical protein n=1 Tax=Collimonas sp. OK607 TaxID=1798194 RepID=UPI0008E36BEF|nr:hypothetical protein [Collimonas sp. OK607]SFB03040.1 hypothetical protein SAMN04515620_11377 [Collimonas sp. OK607]